MNFKYRLIPFGWSALLCIAVHQSFLRLIINFMGYLSNKLKAYLPHLPFIGFGVDRLYESTLTGFGPGLPTLSGLHLMLAKLHTSFQMISTVPLSNRLTNLNSGSTQVSHEIYYCLRAESAIRALIKNKDIRVAKNATPNKREWV
jgi:hypothetical protein